MMSFSRQKLLKNYLKKGNGNFLANDVSSSKDSKHKTDLPIWDVVWTERGINISSIPN